MLAAVRSSGDRSVTDLKKSIAEARGVECWVSRGCDVTDWREGNVMSRGVGKVLDLESRLKVSSLDSLRRTQDPASGAVCSSEMYPHLL